MSQNTKTSATRVMCISPIKFGLLTLLMLLGIALLPVIQAKARTEVGASFAQVKPPPAGTPVPVTGDKGVNSKGIQAVQTAQPAQRGAPAAVPTPEPTATPPPGPGGIITQILQKLVTFLFPAKKIEDGIRKAGFAILKGEYLSARSAIGPLAESAGLATPHRVGPPDLIQSKSVGVNAAAAADPNEAAIITRCKQEADRAPSFFGVNAVACDVGGTLTAVAVPIWMLSLALLGLVAVTNNVSAAGSSLRDIGQEFIRWVLVCLFSGNGILLATVVHNMFLGLGSAILSHNPVDGERVASYLMPVALVSQATGGVALVLIAIMILLGIACVAVMALAMMARYVLTLSLVAMAPLAIATEGIPHLKFIFKDWLSSFLRVELLTVLNSIVIVIATQLLFKNLAPPTTPEPNKSYFVQSMLSIVSAIGVLSIITAMNWSVFRYVFGTAIDAVSQVGKAIASVVGMVATMGASAIGGGMAAAAVSTAGQIGAGLGSPIGQAFNQGSSAAQGILDRRDRAANFKSQEQSRAEASTYRDRSEAERRSNSARGEQRQQTADASRANYNAQQGADREERREAEEQRKLMRAVGANTPAAEKEVNDAVDKLAGATGASKPAARAAMMGASGPASALSKAYKGDLGQAAADSGKSSWGEVVGAYAEEKLRSEGKLQGVAPIFGAPPVASSVASATGSGTATATTGSSAASGAPSAIAKPADERSPGQQPDVNASRIGGVDAQGALQTTDSSQRPMSSRFSEMGATSKQDQSTITAAVNDMHRQAPQASQEIERALDAASPTLRNLSRAAGGSLSSAAQTLGFENAGTLVRAMTQHGMSEGTAQGMSAAPAPKTPERFPGYEGLSMGGDAGSPSINTAIASREATLQAAARNPSDAGERREIGQMIQRFGSAPGSSIPQAEGAVQIAGNAVRAMDAWSGSPANTVSALQSGGYTGSTRNDVIASLAAQHLDPTGNNALQTHPIQPAMLTHGFSGGGGGYSSATQSPNAVNISPSIGSVGSVVTSQTPTASGAAASASNHPNISDANTVSGIASASPMPGDARSLQTQALPQSINMGAATPASNRANISDANTVSGMVSASPTSGGGTSLPTQTSPVMMPAPYSAGSSLAESATAHLQPVVRQAEMAAQGMMQQAGGEQPLIRQLQQAGWEGSNYGQLVSSLARGPIAGHGIEQQPTQVIAPLQSQINPVQIPPTALPAPTSAPRDIQSFSDAVGIQTQGGRNAAEGTINRMYAAAPTPELKAAIDQGLERATPVLSQMAASAGGLEAAAMTSGFANTGGLVGWATRRNLAPDVAAVLPSIQHPRHPERLEQLTAGATSSNAGGSGDGTGPQIGSYHPASGSAHLARVIAPTLGQAGAVNAVSAGESLANVLSGTGNLEALMTPMPSGSPVSSHMRSVGSFAQAYATTIGGSQPLPQLERFGQAPSPSLIANQSPFFHGLGDPDSYAPIFARAQAVSSAATTSQEWQQLSQGIQNAVGAFGTTHPAQVNEGINQVAPVFGAMTRQAGGYPQMITRLNAAGANVQGADQAFTGLVAGYMQEQGISLPGSATNDQAAPMQAISAQVIQRAFPEFQQPAAPGQTGPASAPSLAQYSQAFSAAMQPAPLPQMQPQMQGQAGSGLMMPAPTLAAISTIPGFGYLPSTPNLSAAINARAEALQFSGGHAPTAQEVNGLVNNMATTITTRPATQAVQAAQQLVSVMASSMASSGGLESVLAEMNNSSGVGVVTQASSINSSLASPTASAPMRLLSAAANTYATQVAAHTDPIEGLGTLPAPGVIQNGAPIFAGLPTQEGYGPLFSRAQTLSGIANTPNEWQQVGQGIQVIANGYEPAQAQQAINAVAPLFRSLAQNAGGYDSLVGQFNRSGIAVQSPAQLFAGLAAGYLQESGAQQLTGDTNIGLPISASSLQQTFPDFKSNTPLNTIADYSAAAIQQAAHVEQAQPPTRVGAALFNRPAQPQTNNAPIADAGNTDAPAQENVASQQAVQHPNAYVQSVLYTYGPSAQLSDAPGLQLNPGGVASMQSRIMPAHINLASHIADNIGAGPTQIDPLARTIAQLSRQEFGDGVVRDLIAEAESIGRQPLAPIDKFASFSRTLQTFIEKHLPNRANARSDDPQIRDARNAKGEKRGSP